MVLLAGCASLGPTGMDCTMQAGADYTYIDCALPSNCWAQVDDEHVIVSCSVTATPSPQPTATAPIPTPTPEPTGTPIPTPTPGRAYFKPPASYRPYASQNVRSCESTACPVVGGLAANTAYDVFAAEVWPEQPGQRETWMCMDVDCTRWAAYRYNGAALGALTEGE